MNFEKPRRLRLVVSNDDPEPVSAEPISWRQAEVVLPDYPDLTDDGKMPAAQAMNTIVAIDENYRVGNVEDVHIYLENFPSIYFASRVARRLGSQHEDPMFLELAGRLDPAIFETGA